MDFTTADLCDVHAGKEHFYITEPIFRSFGRLARFCGPISTLKVFEDNVLVRKALEEKGSGRVLVVDGGGSRRCALLGDHLAGLAHRNGWHGVVLYGCVRDTLALREIPIGILALSPHPLPSHKKGHGERDVLITVAGANCRAGHYLYADEDGVIVCSEPLL